MLFSRRAIYFLCLAILFIKKKKCYYFNIINDGNSNNEINLVNCSNYHFAKVNEKILLICLYLDYVEPKNYEYNIHIKEKNENNVWENKHQILKENTKDTIRYFFTFSTENKLIIFFCINKYSQRIPYVCYNTTSYDGDTFENINSNIDYNVFQDIYATIYYSKSLKIFGKEFLLICGPNFKNMYHFSRKDNNLFFVCITSHDGGITWKDKFNLYNKIEPDIQNYLLVKTIITGNEIILKYVSFNDSIKYNYLKCVYKSGYNFFCHDIDLSIEENIVKDLIKIKGYSLTIQSFKEDYSCIFIYLYNSIIYAPSLHIKSNEDVFYGENLYPLDDSSVGYYYMDNKKSYFSVFSYTGSVKHCTLLYLHEDNLNPGFLKNANNSFICTINHDDLITEENNSYFVLSVLNEVKTDLKKCFHFSYDNILYPVNIINRIETANEYGAYKLYIFHIDKNIENNIFKKVSLSCDLGENFTIELVLYNKSTFVIDNTEEYFPESFNLYYDDMIYYKVPNEKDSFFESIIFPRYTRYIKPTDTMYIFKLPSYISETIKNDFYFLTNSNEIKKKEVLFNKGGIIEKVLRVDFSMLHDNLSNVFTESKYSHAKFEENTIYIDIINYEKDSITLKMVCPVDSNNQNICFNDVYENETKVFIKDFFKDKDGFLTIYPKSYVYKGNTKVIYEESSLVISSSFLEKYSKNKADYKNKFTCKCFANQKDYSVVYTLT